MKTRMLRRSLPVVGIAALIAALLMTIALATLPTVGQWHAGDLKLYFNDSQQLVRGKLPYRDFAIEYPPLALAPFVLPWLLAAGRPLPFTDYVVLFLLQNVFSCIVLALALAAICARAAFSRAVLPTLALYAAQVVATAPLLPWRYDLFPALLTGLALLAAARGRPGWAGIWLGLGVAAKLYPVVLLPVFGLYYLAGRERRALGQLALGAAAGTLAPLLPFLLAAPRELAAFLSYHQLRGLQLESLPAGLILFAHVFGRAAAKLEFNYGALHLVSPATGAVLRWLPLAFVLAYALVAAGAWSRLREARTPAQAAQSNAPAVELLAGFCAAALLVFIVTNKVFSPQYLIWLLPFAPLLHPRQALLLLLASLITTLLFPFDYASLIAMNPLPVLLLNMRNLLMLVLLGWLLLDLAPSHLRAAWRLPSQPLAR